MRSTSRRGFLEAAAGLGCVAAVPALAEPGRTASAESPWLRAIGDGEAVRDLGFRCIRCGAVDHDPARLFEQLRTGAEARGWAGGNDDAGLRAALQDLRRSDFESGQVVRVEGWVLARSEARAYALAALLAPAA